MKDLSIKGVPDSLLEKLRKRAASHHRSLQGELMVILEESLRGSQKLSADETIERLRQIELSTPSESAKIVRKNRDDG